MKQEHIIKQFTDKYGGKGILEQMILKKAISKFLNDNTVPENQLIRLQKSLYPSLSTKEYKSVLYLPNAEKQLNNNKDVAAVEIRSQTQQNYFPNPQSKTNLQKTFRQSNQDYKSQPHLIFNPSLLDRQQPFKRSLQKDPDLSFDSQERRKSLYFIDTNRNDDEWAAIVKYDAQQYEKDKIQQQQMKLHNQQHLRLQLDQQVQVKKNQKEAENIRTSLQDLSQQNYLFGMQEKFSYQQEQKNQKAAEFQSLLKKQVRSMHRLQHTEKQDKKQEQIRITQKYDQDCQQVAQEKAFRKKSEVQFMYRAMKQAEDDKFLQLQKEKVLLHDEQEKSNKFGEILEQLENRRNEEIKVKDMKVKRLMNRVDNKAQLQHYQNMLKQENDRYNSYALLDDAKYKSMQQQKLDKKQLNKYETIDVYDSQISHRKAQLEQEKQIDKLQGYNWKQDAQKYLEEEAQKKNFQQLINKNHRQMLVKQIIEKNNVTSISSSKQGKMTVEELMQNKDKLKQILIRQANPYMERGQI